LEVGRLTGESETVKQWDGKSPPWIGEQGEIDAASWVECNGKKYRIKITHPLDSTTKPCYTSATNICVDGASSRQQVLTASLGWWKPGEQTVDENPSGAAARTALGSVSAAGVTPVTNVADSLL
jgi:hypothetical protein